MPAHVRALLAVLGMAGPAFVAAAGEPAAPLRIEARSAGMLAVGITGGGATAQPSRIPGERIFEKVPM